MYNLPLKWNIQIGVFTNNWEHAVTGEAVGIDWPACGIISVVDALAQIIIATKTTILFRACGTRNSFDSFIIGRSAFSQCVALCHYLPEVVIGVCRTISDCTSADHFFGTSVYTVMCVFCSWHHFLITSDSEGCFNIRCRLASIEIPVRELRRLSPIPGERFLYRDGALHVVWAVFSVTSKQILRVTQCTDNLNC